MNQPLIERSVRDLQTCHYLFSQNICALYRALTQDSDVYVLGCGDVGENRLHRAMLFAWLLQCWLEERDVDEEARPLFHQVATLLREPTDRKTALVRHLVRRLHDNAYKIYSGEEEDLATLEARIQHLEICHVDWEYNLTKILHEIGEERLLYGPWNSAGGIAGCGHVCSHNAFPKTFVQTAALRHGVEPPGELTQESVQKAFHGILASMATPA